MNAEGTKPKPGGDIRAAKGEGHVMCKIRKTDMDSLFIIILFIYLLFIIGVWIVR
jgi:hypothetical protein